MVRALDSEARPMTTEEKVIQVQCAVVAMEGSTAKAKAAFIAGAVYGALLSDNAALANAIKTHYAVQ